MTRKIISAVVALFAAAVLLVSCGEPANYISLISTESPSHTAHAEFELNIRELDGAEITAELHQDGRTTTAQMLTISMLAEKLSVTLTPNKLDDSGKIDSVSTECTADNITGNAMFQFTEVNNWAFTAGKAGKKIGVNADDKKILAALAFDTGSGVKTVDLDSINPDEYSCLILICANF